MSKRSRWPGSALIRGWVGVVLAGVLGACHAPPETGTYVGHHPFGADTLILRADSTYYHSFRTPQGTTTRHRGRWSSESLKEIGTLSIENFDWRIRGIGAGLARDTVDSFWPARVERNLWGEQYIAIDEDLDYYYSKIK